MLRILNQNVMEKDSTEWNHLAISMEQAFESSFMIQIPIFVYVKVERPTR